MDNIFFYGRSISGRISSTFNLETEAIWSFYSPSLLASYITCVKLGILGCRYPNSDNKTVLIIRCCTLSIYLIVLISNHEESGTQYKNLLGYQANLLEYCVIHF